MNIVLCGYSRAGKDLGGELLQHITGLKFAGTTSLYLKKHVAQRLGKSEEEVYERRHQNQMLWKQIGDDLRINDPGLLLKEALSVGSITGGLRDLVEVQYARESGLVDLIIWIENIDVPVDPSVNFTSRECDVIIQHNWSIPEYHGRLLRLAKALGIAKKD